MLEWPDAQTLQAALRAWARAQAERCPEIRRIGYVGSYARGDWGVGSDLDIVIVLENIAQPFHLRANGFDTTGLPVPADLLVYSRSEWDALLGSGSRFARETLRDIVWVLEQD